jgi:hypothetical protein
VAAAALKGHYYSVANVMLGNRSASRHSRAGVKHSATLSVPGPRLRALLLMGLLLCQTDRSPE